MQAEDRGVDFAGDGNEEFRGLAGGGCGRGLDVEAQFARSALGAEARGKLEALAGAGGEREGAERFGGVEVGRGAEPGGGVAQQAALERDGERSQASDVDGERLSGIDRGGASAAADGLAGEEELRGDAIEFRAPEGVFVASESGHFSEMRAELGIPGLEQWKQFVTDAIAGEAEMAVGGVFAPRLVVGIEIGFNFGAGGGEQRAKDEALGEFKFWSNAAQTLGPCAAKEFGEDGFGLVVAGVGRTGGVEGNLDEKLPEPGITQAAGSFFDGFGVGAGFSGGVDLSEVEGKVETLGERAGEFEVGVGFSGAQSVVKVGDVEDEAKFSGARGESAEERGGIRSTGERDGETQAGLEQRSVD